MAGSSSTPKDALVIQSILKDLGVTEFEPRVIPQLLDFAYGYVHDVLKEAQVYSEYSGNKKQIDADDVKLAIQMLSEHRFMQPPPRALTAELSREKNPVALPPIKQQYGLRLPPDRFCLLQPNYQLKNRAEIRKTMQLQQQASGASSSSHAGRGTPAVSHRIGSAASTPNFQLSTSSTAIVGAKRKADEANLDEDYDME